LKNVTRKNYGKNKRRGEKHFILEKAKDISQRGQKSGKIKLLMFEMTGKQGERQKMYPNFILGERHQGFKMLQRREKTCCREVKNTKFEREKNSSGRNILREFLPKLIGKFFYRTFTETPFIRR
jgi:hypothetical protein